MNPLHDKARRVIVEGRTADVSPPGSRARNWQALSSRLDATLPPGAAAADRALDAPGKAGLWSNALLKFVILGAVLGGLGAGLLLYPRGSSTRTSVGTAATQAERLDVQAANVPLRPPPASTLPQPQLETAAPDAPPSGHGVAHARADRAGAHRPNRITSSMLRAETRLIAEAQEALNKGAAAPALALLDRHRIEFHHGELVPEREAARVLALCALDREAEAKAARVRFERDWSNSPLLPRVRASCASAAE
jgi:hypothetical protein